MRFLGLIIFVLLSFSSLAQIGGQSTYQFLNTISSAKIASLGGYAIAVPDGDIEMAYLSAGVALYQASYDLLESNATLLKLTGKIIQEN